MVVCRTVYGDIHLEYLLGRKSTLIDQSLSYESVHSKSVLVYTKLQLDDEWVIPTNANYYIGSLGEHIIPKDINVKLILIVTK